jgi:co-chaperonin GroES (HSP10)
MIKMIGSRALIEEIVEDIKSGGGIILGNTKASAQRIGRVISVGDSVEEIKVSDKVMFDSYKAFPIDLDGKTYLILGQDSVIGVYV